MRLVWKPPEAFRNLAWEVATLRYDMIITIIMNIIIIIIT